jgi:hypothetical protein
LPPLQTWPVPQPVPFANGDHEVAETEGWHVWHGLVELTAPLGYKVPPIKHPLPQAPALQYCPLPHAVPVVILAQVPSGPPVLLPKQERQAWSQALLQHTPSGEQVVPAAQPPPAVWQVWPCLLLHAPVLSQVPAQTPGSSWPLSAVHTPPEEQVWHTPPQSLRLTHPTHWLVAVSHVPAAPVQCLLAVHATHRPLVAQARVPVRPAQSLSLEHFAHRLPKQSGLCDEQSLSVLHEPAASAVGPIGGASTGASGRSTGNVSGGLPTAGASGTEATGASGTGATGASGKADTGARSGPEPSGPGAGLTAASGGVGTADPAPSGPTPPGPSAETDTGPSTPPPDRSLGPWLSTEPRASLPPSPGSTQVNPAVQTYPGLHGSSGEQMFQSRFRPHPSPNVTGRRSASTLEHAERWFFLY